MRGEPQARFARCRLSLINHMHVLNSSFRRYVLSPSLFLMQIGIYGRRFLIA
jgi:hypothetical protein